MEARLVEELPDEAGWQFEPKWDGFRCVAYRSGVDVDLRAKSGKPLGRYFPEMVEAVAALPGGDFVLDGELVIPAGGTLSFDALQMRLHPAESRVKKLSRETPALYVLFDMLVSPGGKDIMQEPLTKRRAALEAFFDGIAGNDRFRLSPVTLDRGQAEAWLKRGGGALDGVVAKACDGAYEPGERAMLKVKRLRTADCVVGGFRYASKGHEVAIAAARPFRRRGPAAPCRLYLDHPQRGTRRADEASGKAEGPARLHRPRPGRTEPLVHRAFRRMGEAAA